MGALLKVEDIHVYYGSIHAIKGVSFEVDEGEIVTLFDAIQRKKHDLPVFEKERPGLKFKFSLKKGDIVKWNKDGKEYRCIMRGCWLSNGVPRLILVPVNEARDQKGIKAANLWFTPMLSSAFRGNLRKFRMNVFGELQDAND